MGRRCSSSLVSHSARLGPRRRARRVPLIVERAQADVPVTFGIPMPKGALDNPDHVRVLDSSQREIPSQITDVSTWEPLDPSLKWIWVFFFTTSSSREYILEFGPDVHRAPLTGPKISMVNNQRPGGGIDVTTGPLKFTVKKGNGSGFLDSVYVDADGQGFGEDDLMAVAPADGRGSFLDLVNDAGPDASKAWVRRTTMERGSGPLHAIIRVDGEYRYSKPGHAAGAVRDAHPCVCGAELHHGGSHVRVHRRSRQAQEGRRRTRAHRDADGEDHPGDRQRSGLDAAERSLERGGARGGTEGGAGRRSCARRARWARAAGGKTRTPRRSTRRWRRAARCCRRGRSRIAFRRCPSRRRPRGWSRDSRRR